MKNIFEKLFGKESGLKRKIILLYLFIAVVPIIIITISASIIYYRSILKEAYGLTEQNARQHAIVVQERMNAYEYVLYELITNSDYIKLAKQINDRKNNDVLIDAASMENMLRSSVYTYDGIRSITFLSDNGKYVSYSKWYGSSNELIWSNEESRLEVHGEIEKKQELTFIGIVNLSTTLLKDDNVILMGYPVKNLRTGIQSGVLVMALEDDVLLFNDEQIDKGSSGVTTIILDDDDKILVGVDNKYVNKTYQNYINKEFDNIEKISENRQKIEGTSWTIVNIINTELYRKDIYHLIELVIFLTTCITCLFFIIVFLISKRYITTIQKIAQGIRNYKGMDSEKIETEIDEKDELYVIVSQFNKMTSRVNSLVEKLKQRNEEIKAAAINQKHAEIKALEAQINPHFLFNTLDSINWRAIEHEEEEISDMLGALGSLLRYSVSNIDMVVTLEAEISWLKKYIFLQRDRFNNSFDCQYDITEEALSFPIYKMLLQPIIENTILHAFEEVKKGGMIYVKAFIRRDGRLEISVRDNGSGMPEEVLEEIKKEIQEKGPLDSNKIGISNIIHRLRIYYHEEADILVHSRSGEGTEFILIIPNQRGS